MRAAGGFVLMLALSAAPVSAEVDVQYKGGLVDVRATTAPLAEVLDRLARATGMKVVQQGVTPSMLLSLSIQGRTPAEAVFGVLEGLGLNYAFVLDASGNRIETLILAGSAGGRLVAATTAPPPTPAQRYVPQPATPPPAAGPDASDDTAEEDQGEEAAPDAEEDEPAAGRPGPVPPPRGSVLAPPAEPVFPSSPFAPRAPIFSPMPEPQPTPPPKPPI